MALLGGASHGEATERRQLTFDAQTAAPRPEPMIMGVGVHFGIGGSYNYDPRRAADLVRDIGFTSVRDDLVWPLFVRENVHKNASPPPQIWRLYRFLGLAGVKPLLILGHNHPLIEGGTRPMTAGGREAFAGFSAKAAGFVSRFQPMFEIWNEWNLSADFNPPWVVGAGKEGDPRAARDYLDLVKTTLPALNKAVPKSPVLVGVSGYDEDWLWTQAIMAGGVMRGAQGLSIHLSNHCHQTIAKRTATEAIDRVDLLQRLLMKDGAPPVPVYVSEIGWPTAPLTPCVIKAEQQADYLAQFLFWAGATPWLKGAWVYQLKDQGVHPDQLEDNFGIFTYDYKPKPAACAVREAVRLLKGSSAFRVERPFPDMFVVQLGGARDAAGKVRLVAWTTTGTLKGRLVLPAGVQAGARRLCGGPQAADAEGFAVGSEPLVIDVDGTSATLEAILDPLERRVDQGPPAR
ncbi:hypothetical protein K9U40_15475 [Xanthobacter autotrophicus]|uniref:hypothetical protein n=1 Tax=Xanthobacter TaxID=279 RepID=UPI0024AAA183|nr:hypothetical protein [Xanthobacter autotrophicus]MDI4665711.1 hypothetical protein [Xanthobacter autotrophicus]